MAGFAEMIYGTAENVAKTAGDGAVESYAKGAELAMNRERIAQQQQQIDQEKERLQLAKLEKIGSWFDAGAKMEDGGPKKAFLNNFIPNGITALGMQDAFNPTSLKMFTDQPLIVPFMADKVRRGELEMGDLLGAMANPDKAAQLFGSPEFKQFGSQQEIADAAQQSLGVLKKSAEFAASEEGKAYRTKLVAGAAAQRQATDIGATGPKEIAKKVADEYVQWEAIGGAAAYDKASAALKGAVKQLEDGDVRFGEGLKNIPYVNSREALAYTDKKAKALVDSVLSEANIKALTGDPNPTQAQIDGIYSRLVDVRLSNAENIKKFKAEISKMDSTKRNKERVFVQQGLMPRSAPERKAAPTTQPRAKTVKLGNGQAYSAEQLRQKLQIKNLQPALRSALESALKQLGE